MALCISSECVKYDVTVDLTEGGVSGGIRRKHRTVNGGGAVGPVQCSRIVPQNFSCVFSGCRRAVTENLIAAILNTGSRHIDQDSGINGGDDIDSVQLIEGQSGAVDIGAVETEDIQILISTGQV